jgi:hypothetical protein
MIQCAMFYKFAYPKRFELALACKSNQTRKSAAASLHFSSCNHYLLSIWCCLCPCPQNSQDIQGTNNQIETMFRDLNIVCCVNFASLNWLNFSGNSHLFWHLPFEKLEPEEKARLLTFPVKEKTQNVLREKSRNALKAGCIGTKNTESK